MKRFENAINNILTLPESDRFNASIDLAHALKKLQDLTGDGIIKFDDMLKQNKHFGLDSTSIGDVFGEVKREVSRVKKSGQRAEICNTNEKRWGPEIANYFRNTESISLIFNLYIIIRSLTGLLSKIFCLQIKHELVI